jgi:pimeloyl-ACP methyl ester carboxylesterase
MPAPGMDFHLIDRTLQTRLPFVLETPHAGWIPRRRRLPSLAQTHPRALAIIFAFTATRIAANIDAALCQNGIQPRLRCMYIFSAKEIISPLRLATTTMLDQPQTTRANNLNITYYQVGALGSPVVLLHGGGSDSAYLSWSETIPALAAEHVVYAPDWPGYGGSDVLPGTYTLEALVGCLDRLMDAWRLEKASLVGVSMGGGAAIGYALAHPARVDRLVLVDPYGLQKRAPNHRASFFMVHIPFLIGLTWWSMRRSRDMVRVALRSMFGDPERVSERLVDEVFTAVQDPKPGKSFHSFQRHEITWNGTRTRFAARMAEIKRPTLFIHGEKDTLVPLDEIRAAVAVMPDARLEVMEKTGHWPPREDPQALNRLVVDFLKN